MTHKAYYKTNAPEVMSALKVHEDESKAIRDAGRLFAEHFGGDLLVQNGIHDYRIAGLSFKPQKDTRFWTKPDRERGYCQRPRASIVKATPEEKTELKSLNKQWGELFPKSASSFDPVLKAMGTNWGNLVFGSGFGMFQHNGYAYVVTGAPLAECMQEILASEYQAAKTAHNTAK